MKLALVSEQGIEILTGTGEISDQDIKILAAGITKLLKSGKNRIVLELPDSAEIPKEILSELTKLDTLARELDGRIVLAGLAPQTQSLLQAVDDSSKMQSFADRGQAIGELKRSSTLQTTPVAPAQTSDAGKPQGEGDETQQLKEQIREKELGEQGELRRQLSDLQNENNALKDQLLKALVARRQPVDGSAYAEKIKVLEERLEEIIKTPPAPEKK